MEVTRVLECDVVPVWLDVQGSTSWSGYHICSMESNVRVIAANLTIQDTLAGKDPGVGGLRPERRPLGALVTKMDTSREGTKAEPGVSRFQTMTPSRSWSTPG